MSKQGPPGARPGLAAEDIPWVERSLPEGRTIPNGQAYWRPDVGYCAALARPNGYLELPLIPVHGSFLANKEPPTNALDILFDPLGTVIIQQASFPKALEALHKIHADIFTLAATLEKTRIIIAHAFGEDQLDRVPILLGCEFEYLFVTIRALFDQVQFLIRAVAEETTRSALPQSFNRMLHDKASRYNLPTEIRRWYEDRRDYFQLIRGVRVGIEHYGHAAPNIAVTPGGIAVHVKEQPWHSMPIWSGFVTSGDPPLGSLFRALAWLVDQAIVATETLAPVLRATLLNDAPSLTTWSMYLKSSVIEQLHSLDAMFEGAWDPHAPGMDSHIRIVEWPEGW